MLDTRVREMLSPVLARAGTRLAAAGVPPAALTGAGWAARGKPRSVNNLAVAALVATYAAGKRIVDATAARAAVAEVVTTE